MKALISNKEDTALAITMVGELQTENGNLKNEINNIKVNFDAYKEYAEEQARKEKMAITMGNVMIPVVTVPMIVVGSVLTATNNDYGKPVLYTGLGLLVGCELVWNGGHFIFKIW
jgi:hypothetical protein